MRWQRGRPGHKKRYNPGRRRLAELRAAEEAEWAARSGPVVVRYVDPVQMERPHPPEEESAG